MQNHLIRLRGGWESIDQEVPDRSTRLTLPVVWNTTAARRVRLIRRFGRPNFDPRRERLFLALDRVSGLRGITLNGRPIPLDWRAPPSLEVPLDNLAERNVLVLDTEFPDQTAGNAGDYGPWGKIALLIRTSTGP